MSFLICSLHPTPVRYLWTTVLHFSHLALSLKSPEEILQWNVWSDPVVYSSALLSVALSASRNWNRRTLRYNGSRQTVESMSWISSSYKIKAVVLVTVFGRNHVSICTLPYTSIVHVSEAYISMENISVFLVTRLSVFIHLRLTTVVRVIPIYSCLDLRLEIANTQIILLQSINEFSTVKEHKTYKLQLF